MVSIARKNLFHDKIRFAVALAGISFAVVLITVQLGVYLAFRSNVSVLIDHTEADIWVTAHGLENFDFGRPFSEKKLYDVREVPGVMWAIKYMLTFGYWKTPSGSQETVQMVGFDPETMVGAPWNIVKGNPQDVKYFNSIFYDEAETNRLGNIPIGGETEINDHRVRVAGIVRGARSFIQSPYIFTSYKNAVSLSRLNKGNTVYVLVKVAPGYSVQDVKRRIQETVSDVDVYTSPRVQQEDARLLDDQHRHGRGAAGRGPDGGGDWNGDCGEHHLHFHHRAPEGVRHAESHRGIELGPLRDHHRAGADQLGDRICAWGWRSVTW